MGKKVKELESNPMKKKTDDANCMICHPREDRIPHDKVWRYSRATGTYPLKDGVRV